MGEFRKIGNFWNKKINPELKKAANSVSKAFDRRKSSDGADLQAFVNRIVELKAQEMGVSLTPPPVAVCAEIPEASSHQELISSIPEDPAIPPVQMIFLPPPPLTFHELLAQGGLTKYHHFQLDEFDDATMMGLGAGGQAHVYLLLHPTYGAVAVKMFHGNSPTRHREREMKNIMKLQGHPGVIRLFGFVYNRDKTEIIGYVMEHETLSMADVIFNDNPSGEWVYEYSIAQAVKWIIEAAACMTYLHQEEVLHRDLKPHNILIAWDHLGKPIRICDLGFSKDVFLSSGILSKNVGTPLYRPPEMMLSRQTEGESEIHKAGDVYSLAITFWELLHRQKEPSLGRNEIEIFVNIGQGMRSAIDASCPEELAEIIRSCWAKDVKRRPTMKELKEMLENVLVEKEEWKNMIVSGTDEKGVEISEF